MSATITLTDPVPDGVHASPRYRRCWGARRFATVMLAVGIALFALLASRIRRAWHRRRDARLGRRSSGGRMAGVPSPLL